MPPGVLYPDNEPAPEPCKHLELEATAWFDFDAEKHYPRAGKCKSCGEVVTRTSIEISNADELMTFGNDVSSGYDLGCYTISITDDIDMFDKAWPEIKLDGYSTYNGRNFIINGNDYTIENLSTGDSTSTNPKGFISYIWSSSTLEVNNLTLLKATITANAGGDKGPGVGGFIGYIDSSASVKFNDCHVIGSTISGGHWAGGIYGYAAGYNEEGNGPVVANIEISGCSVEDTEISSTDASIGGIMGHAGGNSNTKINVSDSSVIGRTISSIEGDDKIGNILGTNGVGDTILTNVTFSNNTLNRDFSNTKVYGRTVFNEDGSLTIDGIPVTE